MSANESSPYGESPGMQADQSLPPPVDRENPQVRTSEERLASIIRAATEAIITIDDSHHIVLFNPAAEKLFGYSSREALGAPLSMLIPQRFRSTHDEDVRRFGVTGVSERQMGMQRALAGLRKNGEEFPIEASISQIVDNGGRLYTVMLRDITERVQAQEALRTSREELRQLSDNIQAVREEEKKRFARELHDDLGQSITALKMDVAALEADLRALDLGAAMKPMLEQTRSMHQLIDQTVASLRRIAADLRPTLLDDLGLIPAIGWLASDFMRRYQIKADIRIEDADFDFSPTASTTVFRIVQEALTNVARHAQASRVAIDMAYDADFCVLVVKDDGCGMDVTVPMQGDRKSFGLLGIRERVRLLQGKVSLDSQEGRGTTLSVRLPRSALL